MSPRENLRRLLDSGSPAWIPFSLDVGAIAGFSGPVQRTFRRETGGDDPAGHFGADVRRFSLSARFGGKDPAALHESVARGTTFDEWGIGHRSGGTEGALDQTFPPLARAESVRQIEALPQPVIRAPVDPSAVDAFHQAGYPVFGYAGSLYEWCWWIRGMEAFLADMVSGSPLAAALLAKVEAHTTRLALATARLGVDVLCFYDDAGMQTGMQISPSLWRRFIKPAWRRVLSAVRAERPEARFFLHSCGKIEPIVPDIVELGFHVLHPVQPECMSFAGLHAQYGQQIVLAATVSSQRIFPFGTAEDVRQEVRQLAQIVGPGRRTILMPSNVIQPETPWENVVAFAQESAALRNASG